MPNQFPVPSPEDRIYGSAEVKKNNEAGVRIAEQPATVEVAEALRRAMAAYTPRDMTKHEIHPAGELAEHAVTGVKIETSVPQISIERIAGIGAAFQTVRQQEAA